MITTILRRRDPARNMNRFYVLRVERDLFGAWLLLREWGRFGRPGRVLEEIYATEADANAARDRLSRRKRRRGYRPSGPEAEQPAEV